MNRRPRDLSESRKQRSVYMGDVSWNHLLTMAKVKRVSASQMVEDLIRLALEEELPT